METLLARIRWFLEALLMVTLLAMVALTFADVLGRHLFNHPIYGAHDLTEHLMAVLVFCGLPLVTAAGMHLTVDLMDKFMPFLTSKTWGYVIATFMAAIFLLAAWTFLKMTQEARLIFDNSLELQIPRWPLYLFMAFSFLVSAATAFSWARGHAIRYDLAQEDGV